MPKVTNSIRLTKEGLDRIDTLLIALSVQTYHKTLLKGIKDRASKKNLSKSDIDIFSTINEYYEGI